MIDSALFWLLLNLLTILILAFFSMEEMACVSFNKVRLQFYVSQGSRRAIWINELLNHPSQLFATTLIGVNAATFVGSECARKFHEALGISPDLAPLSQIVLVIIFGELAPMFAARSYSEHVALIGAPLLYYTSIILSPLIWVLSLISKGANILIGGQETHPNLFLTMDELHKVIQEQEEEKVYQEDAHELTDITANIFRLRGKFAYDVMTPITEKIAIPSQFTVDQLRQRCNSQSNFFLVYHRSLAHIIGVVFIRDLIRENGKTKIREFCNPPWFIARGTPLFQILKQFKRNSENVAIVLDERGQTIGYLEFEDILNEIFSKPLIKKQSVSETFIDRTFDAEMSLAEFKEEAGLNLPGEADETLSHFLIHTFGHHPESGESIVIAPYEFTVKETTLLGIKSVNIRTIVD